MTYLQSKNTSKIPPRPQQMTQENRDYSQTAMQNQQYQRQMQNHINQQQAKVSNVNKIIKKSQPQNSEKVSAISPFDVGNFSSQFSTLQGEFISDNSNYCDLKDFNTEMVAKNTANKSQSKGNGFDAKLQQYIQNRNNI